MATAGSDSSRMNSRERILRASAELFHERGYSATSINDITKRLGMVKSALYHHFASKEHILSDILDRGLDDLLVPLEEIAASDMTAMEKLRGAVLHELRSVTQGIDAPVAAVVLREPSALRPEIRERFIARRDRAEKIFRQIVSEGIETGEFRPVNPKVFTFAILGMCNWSMHWYSPSGPLDCDQIAEAFFDYAVHGLGNNS